MDTRTFSNRFLLECCVCGTSGQNFGFTPLSDILPSEDSNITQTITAALGVQIAPTTGSVICEACHLKIFNFKTFAIECNRRRELVRQSNCENSASGIYQSIETPGQVIEKLACTATKDSARNSPMHVHAQNAYQKEISDTFSNGNSQEMHAQCQTQTIPTPKAITSLSPFHLPTGTVMLKKETSSVYILPDGTTVEFLDQNMCNKNTNQTQQKQPIRLPIASTSQKALVKNQPLGVIPSAVPLESKPKGIGGTPISVPYAKPTVILTDSVPVPTLLLPRKNFISAPPPTMPIRTNSAGKVAIPRIQHCVKARLPPMILPKVGADVSHLHCPMCNIFFIKKADMKAHLLTHPEAKMCALCERLFPSKNELVSHMSKSHPELLCPVFGCKFLSPNVETLNQHTASHNELKRHQCAVCGKKFKKMTYLRFHKKQHSADRQTFKCHTCDKLFKSKLSLGYHLKFHKTGHSKCPKCEKKFQFKESLLRHLAAMHSSSAPFACEICNQKCADQQSKNYHMKTHDKEKHKTELCPVQGCDFRDFYQYRIRRHVQRMHKKEGPKLNNIKENKCPFCGLAIDVMGDHLSEGHCRLQGLIHEVLNRTSKREGPNTSGTNCNRQDAENVLQKYREQLETSKDRSDLDSLTQASNNEFFEDLVKTIKKLRERLNHNEKEPARNIETTFETLQPETNSSSTAYTLSDVDCENGNICNAAESDSVSHMTKMLPPCESREGQLLVVCESSSPDAAGVQYVLPPSSTDPNQDVQYQEVVTSSGTETYQEIIVEGDNVTEDMVKMVETALQSGVFESGTSFIIVDKSTSSEEADL